MENSKKLKPVISNKPYSIPIEMRPLWRISLILISISTLGGDNCYLSVKKVNMLVWMLIRKMKWREYEDFLFDRSHNIPLVSVDTATYKAVEFALAKGFVTLEDGRLYITSLGKDIYSLLTDNNIMSPEVDFLKNTGKKLTDKKIKMITGSLL